MDLVHHLGFNNSTTRGIYKRGGEERRRGGNRGVGGGEAGETQRTHQTRDYL